MWLKNHHCCHCLLLTPNETKAETSTVVKKIVLMFRDVPEMQQMVWFGFELMTSKKRGLG